MILEPHSKFSIIFFIRFCERFPHSVRQEVATNPKELLLFLKLNRNIFFIRSNKVSLVRNRSPEEEGSESGLSTEGSTNTTEGKNNRVAPAGGPNNNALFSLTRENISKISLVKCLKAAQARFNFVIHKKIGSNSICIQEAVREFTKEMESAAAHNKFLAVDFKVIHLGDELLSMIIVASSTRMACFDMAHNDGILLNSGLNELLESTSILKVPLLYPFIQGISGFI
jgi:hypothetical protein